jgi:hypothetical protein
MTTCTYTFGTDMDFRGEFGAVRVTIEPDFGGDANHIIWQATGQVLADFEFGDEAVAGQNVSIDLPHVDQDGFVAPSQQTITDFAYRATIVARAPDGTERVRYKILAPQVGEDFIDGDTVPSWESVSPVYGPPPVGGGSGISDAAVAAFIADADSDTRAVLNPLIDTRAEAVTDAALGPEIDPVLLFENALL